VPDLEDPLAVSVEKPNAQPYSPSETIILTDHSMEFDDNTINTDRGLLDGSACVNTDTTLPGEEEEPVIDRAIRYNSCSREDDDWFEQHPKDSQAGLLLIPSCNEDYGVCNTTSQLLTEGDNSDS
jgi:hypothetical protein